MNDQPRSSVGSTGSTAGVSPEARTCPIKPRWLRRLGAAAFVFFLIKGLMWLLVPAGLVLWQMLGK